jgi:hypothetical protein
MGHGYRRATDRVPSASKRGQLLVSLSCEWSHFLVPSLFRHPARIRWSARQVSESKPQVSVLQMSTNHPFTLS